MSPFMTVNGIPLSLESIQHACEGIYHTPLIIPITKTDTVVSSFRRSQFFYCCAQQLCELWA